MLPGTAQGCGRQENAMPTVLRVGRYRFYFYSNERHEPPHIHVQAGSDQAKFWLSPIALASSYGFRAHELNQIMGIIRDHEATFTEVWHEHFGQEQS
jgi:hypothetical protein